MYDQVMIGVSYASDWLREWQNFFGLITEQSKAKLHFQIIFDNQLKSDLKRNSSQHSDRPAMCDQKHSDIIFRLKLKADHRPKLYKVFRVPHSHLNQTQCHQHDFHW